LTARFLDNDRLDVYVEFEQMFGENFVIFAIKSGRIRSKKAQTNQPHADRLRVALIVVAFASVTTFKIELSSIQLSLMPVEYSARKC
jgi:hypothetical protein